MTSQQYLESVLEANKFVIGSDDHKDVQKRRDEVEGKLRGEFGSKIQTVKYSGSIAKSTAVKGSYDLDIAVHFKNGSFDTLKGMYDAVHDFLKKHYSIRRQRVSVALKDLHVDVVPGRRINPDDTSDNDVNLYRTDTETRIKTNIVLQVSHVSASDARELIKLAKIWRDVWNLSFKSFAMELLVIKALDGFETTGLDAMMRQVLTYIRDNVETVALPDPGNHSNDVASTIDSADKTYVKKDAAKGLGYLESEEKKKEPDMEDAWRKVFRDEPAEGTEESGSSPLIVTQDRRTQVDRTHG